MAKKSKKQSRTTSAAAQTTVQANAAAYSPSTSTTGRTFDSEFNPDYSQTIKDLRRIGILAGSFIALLVILAFFLR